MTAAVLHTPLVLVDTFIAGRPKTKGSMVVNRQGAARDTDASKHWRALMAGGLRDDYRRRILGPAAAQTAPDTLPLPYPKPVKVSAVFVLPVDPTAHGAGDLDKLLRNLLDALGTPRQRANPKLSASVITDDNLVVEIISTKSEAPPVVGAVGVRVRVVTLT